MSLIAGYVSKEILPEEIVRSKVNAYKLLQKKSDLIINIKSHNLGGHLISVHTEKSVLKPILSEDKYGNIFMSIGYLKNVYTDRVMNSAFELGKEEINVDGLISFEGEFCAVYTDCNKKALHIINDRFAAKPFYIYEDSEGCIFSSDLLFLMHFSGKKFKMDKMGWYQIFKYCHTLGTTTNFEHVRKLFPAAHLIIDENGLGETIYWRLKHIPQNEYSVIEYSSMVFNAFKKATEWREKLFGNSVMKTIALSGGLDSRLLTAASDSLDEYLAITLGDDNSPDIIVAKEVAKILNIKHKTLKLEYTPLTDIADSIIEHTAGMVPIHASATNIPVYELVSTLGGILFGGWPGDVLAGAYIPLNPLYLKEKNTEKMIRNFIEMRGIGNGILKSLLKDDVFEVCCNECSQIMYKNLMELEGPTAAHKVTAWGMVYRQPSFSFMSPAHQRDDIIEITPCLGYEYNDLMLGLPAEWLYNRNFYKAMIYNELPHLRKVKYANTGEYLDGKMSMKKDIKHRIPGWMKEILIENFIRKKTEFYDYLLNSGSLITEIYENLKCSSELNTFLDVKKVEKFIKRFRDGSYYNGTSVHLMACLISLYMTSKKYN